MANDTLFAESLIDKSVKDALPESYSMRPLSRNDYSKGYFECLQALTWTGQVTKERFEEHYDWMKSKGDGWFYNVVIEHDNRVVGTAVLIVERKLYVIRTQSRKIEELIMISRSIWGLGMCGHVEDVSVAQAYQGKRLGLRLIQALNSIAQNIGCQRCILNCSAENEGFYAKCGYKRGSLEMKLDFPGFEGG